MNRDQAIGAALTAGAIAGIVAYGWLMFFSKWWETTLKLTAFIVVAAALGLVAWIGYTLATTPPPKPIEEIEKELEQELKKLESEMKAEEGKKAEESKAEKAEEGKQS